MKLNSPIFFWLIGIAVLNIILISNGGFKKDINIYVFGAIFLGLLIGFIVTRSPASQDNPSSENKVNNGKSNSESFDDKNLPKND